MKNHLLASILLLILFSGCDNSKSFDTSEDKAVENFVVDYYNVMSVRNWEAYPRVLFPKGDINYRMAGLD